MTSGVGVGREPSEPSSQRDPRSCLQRRGRDLFGGGHDHDLVEGRFVGRQL